MVKVYAERNKQFQIIHILMIKYMFMFYFLILIRKDSLIYQLLIFKSILKKKKIYIHDYLIDFICCFQMETLTHTVLVILQDNQRECQRQTEKLEIKIKKKIIARKSHSRKYFYFINFNFYLLYIFVNIYCMHITFMLRLNTIVHRSHIHESFIYF